MARRLSAKADGLARGAAHARGRQAVRVVQLDHAKGLALPAYASSAAAGADLVAAVADGKPIRLEPGARALVPTGIVIELDEGFEAQVRPRSGLALRHGVTVLNSPGTIDADYRGEVQVLLVNLGDKPFDIARGERIAQLVIAAVAQVTFVAADALTSTLRGAGGFGSTGTGSVIGFGERQDLGKGRATAASAETGSAASSSAKTGKTARPGPKAKPKASRAAAASKRAPQKR